MKVLKYSEKTTFVGYFSLPFQPTAIFGGLFAITSFFVFLLQNNFEIFPIFGSGLCGAGRKLWNKAATVQTPKPNNTMDQVVACAQLPEESD